jgi:hypothetical protein
MRALALVFALSLSLFLAIPAGAAENPLLGTWKVVGGEPDAGPYRGEIVEFTAKDVKALPPLGCGNPRYETTRIPPEGLFQGTLPAGRQQAEAERLGLGRGPVPGVDVTCTNGLFSYHFRTDGDLLLGLDNRILRLHRP